MTVPSMGDGVSRVPRWVYGSLAVGLVAASQSGNIVRLGSADPAAIVGWRLALSFAVLAPFAWRYRGQALRLTALEWLLAVTCGMLLAAHLLTWVAAVQHTRVATASLLFAVNPVYTALGAAAIYGEKVTGRLWLAILLGLAGAAVLGWGDVRVGGDLTGPFLALACGMLFTAYFLVGKRLRVGMDNLPYVTLIYGVAGAVTLLALPAMGLPFVDYDGRTWGCFLLMAAVPTLMGHTSFNMALRYLDASRLSVATLSEPAMAGLGAWVFWGEAVTPHMAAGYAFIAASVVVLVSERGAGRGGP
jgi:drug/metabolite transporter (DMT)-like permease